MPCSNTAYCHTAYMSWVERKVNRLPFGLHIRRKIRVQKLARVVKKRGRMAH